MLRCCDDPVEIRSGWSTSAPTSWEAGLSFAKQPPRNPSPPKTAGSRMTEGIRRRHVQEAPLDDGGAKQTVPPSPRAALNPRTPRSPRGNGFDDPLNVHPLAFDEEDQKKGPKPGSPWWCARPPRPDAPASRRYYLRADSSSTSGIGCGRWDWCRRSPRVRKLPLAEPRRVPLSSPGIHAPLLGPALGSLCRRIGQLCEAAQPPRALSPQPSLCEKKRPQNVGSGRQCRRASARQPLL